MCGIAGVINLNGAPVDRELLVEMTDIVAHRGPDDSGYEFINNVGLGHRRLSIIDLAGGHQPMYSHDRRFVIVFNGEIFNYIELKAELESCGSIFKTSSDTEVIMEAFRKFGAPSFDRLNGQFAFSLYDLKNQETYLVRDRLGEKPLYWARLGNSLVFGSEVKVIFKYMGRCGLSPKLSAQDLFDYLSLNYIPLYRTMVEGVLSVKPGHYIKISDNQIDEHDYKASDSTLHFDAQDAVGQLTELLINSARLRLRSDVPVGVFLSGGIDSTVVSWAASKSAKPKAFIVHFPSLDFSEKDQALDVCGKLGLPYDIVEVSPEKENLRSVLEHLSYHCDAPLADSSAFPVCLLSRHVSKEFKVVLSGDGGDELFAGYLMYPATLTAKRMGSWLRQLGSRVAFAAEIFPASNRKVDFKEKLARFLRYLDLPPGAAHFAWNGMFKSEEKLKLLSPEIKRQLRSEETFSKLASSLSVDLAKPTLKQLMLADRRNYLCQDILAKVDRMTMSAGLEARPVFLDPSILSFSEKLPDALLLKGTSGKEIIKRFLAKELPWYSVSKKQGFSIPVNAWFREKPNQVREILLDENLVGSFFNREELQKQLDLHLSRKRNLGFELWGIMTFLIWSKTFSVS